MQAVLSQVALPIVLAFIMFAMGLGLKPQHFRALLKTPQILLLGLLAQMALLPSLALILIIALGLEGATAAGLFLLSLCPGGATSNLFSYLARGNVALSIALTAITSLLVPFTLPLMFGSFLDANGDGTAEVGFPVLVTIKQLLVVTAVPVLLGMALRHFFPLAMSKAEPACKMLATVSMIVLVVLLIATNLPLMLQALSMGGLAVLLLSGLAILFGWSLSNQFGGSRADSRTIAIEAGIQNAGTAILVALAFLHQPELAAIPLMYGLLMNLPGFGFIAWVRMFDKREESASGTMQH